jgi:small-conductance mechanosensitive channel
MFAVWLASALLLVMSTVVRAAPGETGTGMYVDIESLDWGLPPLGEPVNLQTPQACVENFILAARAEEWRRAAASLNFRLIESLDEDKARQLARELHFVLKQELWIDWERLPDRRDGMLEGSALTGSSAPMAGEARRSIHLGGVDLNGRTIPIRVQRVKAPNRDPVWLFSAQTVDNVALLHDAHGPGWLAQQMPTWAQTRLPGQIPAWQLAGMVLAIVVNSAIGYLVGLGLCHWLARRLTGNLSDLLATLRWPLTAATATLLIWFTFEIVLAFPSAVAAALDPLVLTLAILSVVWLAMRLLSFAIDSVIRRAVRSDEGEVSEHEQRLLTQLTVARHVVLVLVALAGLALLLVQFEAFRTVGVALLSSAGAAAVILGIAGHAVIGNLIAGVQIALARPFRIDDTVYIEGNWGRIEEITYVNVIVRTWDERRLVLPVKYFVSNWFENWSRNDPYLIKPIYLNVDYRADVQAIREKFVELVEADEDWDRERGEAEVLVTELGDETIVVRLTAGGPDSSAAWSLSCRVREKLIAWLQQVEDGAYLPRQRVLLNPEREGDDGAAGADEHDSRLENRRRPQPQQAGGDDGDGESH